MAADEYNTGALTREIILNPRLAQIYMDYLLASEEDKKRYRFVRYIETGELDILVDNTKKTLKKETRYSI